MTWDLLRKYPLFDFVYRFLYVLLSILFVVLSSVMSFLIDLIVFIHVFFLWSLVPFFPFTEPRLRLRPFFFWRAILFFLKLLRPCFGFSAMTPSLMRRLTSSEVMASSMSAVLVGSSHTPLSPHFIIFEAIVFCDFIFLTLFF